MYETSTFDFMGIQLRVVVIDGNPWFVAKDVCEAIDLTNPTKAVAVLGDDEVRHISRSNLNLGEVSFPNRGANCISESGLYKLVMRSDKWEARAFQDWVTKIVLPAIRKDGAYIKDEEMNLPYLDAKRIGLKSPCVPLRPLDDSERTKTNLVQ